MRTMHFWVRSNFWRSPVARMTVTVAVLGFALVSLMWVTSQDLQQSMDADVVGFNGDTGFVSMIGNNANAAKNKKDEDEVQPSRRHRDRLLCFVLTDADRPEASLSVKETWGSRCDHLLFFSSRAIPQLSTVVLPDAASTDGYYRLWGKVRRIWTHLRTHHLRDFDWFLKADDDTYVIVDNLRSFLGQKFGGDNWKSNADVTSSEPAATSYPPEQALWFGARLRNPKVTKGYHSGGAGYVLNRRALELFDDGLNCSQMNFGYEDLEMGRCLERIGVEVVDTRDSSELPTFLPFSPIDLLHPRRPSNDVVSLFNDPLDNRHSWYWKTVWSPHQLGRNCCSPHVISFHRVKPKMMYAMDFLIYSLKLGDHQQR